MSSDFETMFATGIPADYCLNSVFEIEDLLEMVRQLEDKVGFYTELKRYRTKVIDEEIAKLEERSDSLRKVVLNTMKHANKRSLNFPSIGKVVCRAGKTTWQIDDEDKLMDFLDKQGVKSQVVQVKEVVDKKALTKVLDNMSDQDIHPVGVKKIEAQEGISITYEKDDSAQTAKPKVATKPTKQTEPITEDVL